MLLDRRFFHFIRSWRCSVDAPRWWRPSAAGLYYYPPGIWIKAPLNRSTNVLHGLVALYAYLPEHAYLTPKCFLDHLIFISGNKNKFWGLPRIEIEKLIRRLTPTKVEGLKQHRYIGRFHIDLMLLILESRTHSKLISCVICCTTMIWTMKYIK